jgi:hypothetical protein
MQINKEIKEKICECFESQINDLAEFLEFIEKNSLKDLDNKEKAIQYFFSKVFVGEF